MKHAFFLASLLFCVCTGLSAQSHKRGIKVFQKKLNQSYADPSSSPLPPDKINGFAGLPFFPIDGHYRVTARFQKLPENSIYTFQTSDKRLRDYGRYALAVFSLDGQEYQLTLYKSTAKVITPGYENSLFLPFTDRSNGRETYGGGRYMDVEIPEGDTIVLDFNRAYNPYCAYSDRYSCPIPPRENDLPIAIPVGVKYEK